LLLVISLGAGVWYWLSRSPSDAIQLSGRIEGYPTDVDVKVSGRIESVSVREGDRVEAGQVIAILDDAELQAQLEGAQARISAAQQRQRQAELQLGVIQSQIQEAQLNVEQSSGDAQGRIYQAEANVAAAEAQLNEAIAQLEQARAELNLAQVNRDRFDQLYQEGVVPAQRYDEAQTIYESAIATVSSREASVAAAQRQVNASQGALAQAQTTAFNPSIRTAQLDTLQRQLAVAQAELAAAQAEVQNAQASYQETQARMADLTIASPIDGVVITRSVEPGTVVSPGATLLTVIDPHDVHLRGFIPEGEIGEIRVGQPARVYLDSAPDRPLEATVSAIDTEASFTPENIYFQEDRVRQVFGVELRLENADGFAKPGMPADGEILTEEDS
jgi:HlyD family secretion protein